MLKIKQFEKINFKFSNVNFKVKNKHILNNVSGVVKPGEILAIMGPSGSGKTSLLNILAGRLNNENISGDILVNNKKPSKSKFKYYSKYVQQEDNLVGSSSVFETLDFSAKLHFNESKKDRIKRVNDMIKDLGLSNVADVNIGNIFQKGLSGGEKRRVSIGIEMITTPKLVFLDEPTSGLDSASAYYIMKLLKEFALQGRTIICSIHQPSSQIFNLLDKILLLSKGNPVYFGESKQVVDYFSDLGYRCPIYTNPSDYILELINDNFVNSYVNDLIIKYEYDEVDNEEMFNENFENDIQITNVSSFKQFIYLSKRMMIENLKNPGVIWVRMLMYTMLSLMIGFMYFDIGNDQTTIQDRISVAFYVVAFMVFMSIAVIPTFISERAIFTRETRNGWYSIGAYTLSNMVTQLPTVILLSGVTTVIIYPMVQLNSGDYRWLMYFCSLFSALLVAENFMTLISVLVPYYIIGMALGAGTFGLFMLCCGFFVLPSNIPTWFIWGYFGGFHTYVFELFMWTEFKDLKLECNPNIPCLYNSGNDVLKYYEMDIDSTKIYIDFGVLFGFVLLFRFLTYLILKNKFRKIKH